MSPVWTLPGFPGTWIREIHERAATLAAHLEIDIAHDSYSSAEVWVANYGASAVNC